MNKSTLYVIISVGIPKREKLNSLIHKVLYVTLFKSRAEKLFKFINDKLKNQTVLYGIECNLYNSIVPVDFYGELNEVVYVVVYAAIPKQKGMNPLQCNVHSVYSDRNQVEKIGNELLNKKEIIVKGIECFPHVSIIESKVDKNE